MIRITCRSRYLGFVEKSASDKINGVEEAVCVMISQRADVNDIFFLFFFFFFERNFLHTHFAFSLLQIKEDIRDVLMFLGYCTELNGILFLSKTVLLHLLSEVLNFH